MLSVRLFLIVQILILAGFGLAYFVRPQETANLSGMLLMAPAALTDVRAYYGGLQLGLAFLFAWFAWTQQMRTGLVLAMALYLPIVLFRSVALLRWWPVETATLALAVTEWLMLAAAFGLWWQGRSV